MFEKIYNPQKNENDEKLKIKPKQQIKRTKQQIKHTKTKKSRK